MMHIWGIVQSHLVNMEASYLLACSSYNATW